jgi:uncharacterized FlaG/YvyC family protein
VDAAAPGSASASDSTTGTLAPHELSQLIAELSAHIALGFIIDPATRRIIVQVIDRDTNQVLREIPSKEIRELAVAMQEIFRLFDITV